MEKLWINPVVVGMFGLVALATAPVRSFATGLVPDRSRHRTEAARFAQERAFAAWAFDEDHQVWIPGVLRP